MKKNNSISYNIKRIIVIILFSTVIALIFNHISFKGISLFASQTKQISIDEAYQYYISDRVLFIDTRPVSEFKENHIKGAINIDYEEIEKGNPQVLLDIVNTLPRDRVIITYCKGQTCNTSINLAKELENFGFNKVKVFFGGWPLWDNAGYPKESANS